MPDPESSTPIPETRADLHVLEDTPERKIEQWVGLEGKTVIHLEFKRPPVFKPDMFLAGVRYEFLPEGSRCRRTAFLHYGPGRRASTKAVFAERSDQGDATIREYISSEQMREQLA